MRPIVKLPAVALALMTAPVAVLIGTMTAGPAHAQAPTCAGAGGPMPIGTVIQATVAGRASWLRCEQNYVVDPDGTVTVYNTADWKWAGFVADGPAVSSDLGALNQG